jgi:hypothetical protein
MRRWTAGPLPHRPVTLLRWVLWWSPGSTPSLSLFATLEGRPARPSTVCLPGRGSAGRVRRAPSRAVLALT